MPGKVWNGITYPFLNFNGATVIIIFIRFLHSHNCWLVAIFVLTSKWPESIYQHQNYISRPTGNDIRGITHVSVPHRINPWTQDGHRSSSWITPNPFLRKIENHHLHWFNMTESCKYYTILQCIWKPCRNHCYQRPMCICYFWRPSWILHQDDHQT